MEEAERLEENIENKQLADQYLTSQYYDNKDLHDWEAEDRGD